jgi:NADPH:quinone reductase-like Zn-dependent oxidoreductase
VCDGGRTEGTLGRHHACAQSACLVAFLTPRSSRSLIANLKKDDLAALCELMKTGKVTPMIDKRYQLSGTADAIAYVEQGHARAKVVVSFE